MKANKSIQPFVIIFVPRSGSTFLKECLDSHPSVNCEGEKFTSFIEKKQSSQVQLAWADQFFSESTEAEVKAIGFKTKTKDILDADGFKNVCEQNAFKIILLTRKNFLKQAISLERAIQLNEQTGDWNLYKKDEKVGKLHIDPDRLERNLKDFAAGKNAVLGYGRSFDCPQIEFEYEDLIRSVDSSCNKIFDLLGVPHAKVRSKTIKHTPDDLRNVVSNYEELRTVFSKTEFADMF